MADGYLHMVYLWIFMVIYIHGIYKKLGFMVIYNHIKKKTSINKNQLQLERKVGIFDHLYMVYQWDKDGIVY